MNINDDRNYEVLDTSPTFNYKIGEWVWFMQDNIPVSGRIWSRHLTERYQPLFFEVGGGKFQSSSKTVLSIVYNVYIGEVGTELPEEKLFSCKQGLIMSL